MKPALEFCPTDDVDWSAVEGQPGVSERVLALDPAIGTVHGPWVSEEGCVMLETRYLPAEPSAARDVAP